MLLCDLLLSERCLCLYCNYKIETLNQTKFNRNLRWRFISHFLLSPPPGVLDVTHQYMVCHQQYTCFLFRGDKNGMCRHFRNVIFWPGARVGCLSACAPYANIAWCKQEQPFDPSDGILYESRISVSCFIEEYSVWQWIRCL
jgi:hypothetical protein